MVVESFEHASDEDISLCRNVRTLRIGETNSDGEFVDSFTVEPKATIIILNDLDTIYNSGCEYKVKLTDVDGNPLGGRELEYTLNNVTGTLVTDENGEASLNIALETGVYTFEVIFNGEIYG